MATTLRRGSRTGRARKPNLDALAIAALDEEVSRPPAWADAMQTLTADDVAIREAGLAADADLRRRHTAFRKDAAAAHRQHARGIRDSSRLLGDGVLADIFTVNRELLHVYGPDTAGTKGPRVYTLTWGSIDGFSGTGSGSTADARTGKMSASHYSVSGWLNAYAGVGFSLTPQVAACWLSLRPYMPWSGSDTLYHRVFDGSLGEQRWAVAEGLLGVIIQSCKPDGSDFRTDGRTWVPMWKRSETNPSGGRSYDGTASTGDGLRLDVPATSGRRYTLWVACRARVFADPGFAVATMASAGISAAAPFTVVEEIPL